jgi:hypothetical protein
VLPNSHKSPNQDKAMSIEPVFVFDLDGTLVDSVYQHVSAWREALEGEGIYLSFWRIHRKVGMSGGLLANQLLRETGIEISAALVERLKERHAAAYKPWANTIRPLPGAIELLSWLTDRNIPWLLQQAGIWRLQSLLLPLLGSMSTRRPSWPAIGSNMPSPSRPLYCCRPAWRDGSNRRGSRRQHLGYACRKTLPGARRWPTKRRLRLP